MEKGLPRDGKNGLGLAASFRQAASADASTPVSQKETGAMSAVVFGSDQGDELLENLNRTFHRLRQSGIDEELFDIVSGFEALASASNCRPT